MHEYLVYTCLEDSHNVDSVIPIIHA